MSDKSVLIADGNPDFRAALRIFLEGDLQMRISGEAADGVEAIEQAKRENPDLIVMGLSMPMINGVEAASIVKKLLPGIRLILFTLYSDTIRESLARAAGIDLVIPKSEGARALIEGLRRINCVAPTDAPLSRLAPA